MNKQKLVKSDKCNGLSSKDGYTISDVGSKYDIATFFYTDDGLSVDSMWESETELLSRFASGVNTTGGWPKSQQAECTIPLEMLCGYGFTWEEEEYQKVSNDWKPEVGITPIRVVPLPNFMDSTILESLERKIADDSYLLWLYSFPLVTPRTAS